MSYRLGIVVLAALLLAGCARFTLVETKPQQVGKLQVEPGIPWNRVATRHQGDLDVTDMWTIDGDGLHLLVFASAVADNEPILAPVGGRQDMPKFRKDMGLDEIASGFEAAMTRITRSTIFSFTAVEPATVFGRPGLRMAFAYTGEDEVDRDGVAVAAVHDSKLYLIVYQGTRLLHFGKYLPEVERVITTARFAEKG